MVGGLAALSGFTSRLRAAESDKALIAITHDWEISHNFWINCLYPPHLYGDPMQEPTPAVRKGIVAAQAKVQSFVSSRGQGEPR